MKLCKTCKYWERSKSSCGEIPGIGKCRAVVMVWSATEWSDTKDSRVLKLEHAAKLAFVRDGSDYYAELQTLPDFGCVQHEA